MLTLRRRQAFSLVELMVVIALLALLMMAAIRLNRREVPAED